MKKMMIIAALIGGMLMPAQLYAKNDRGGEKPRVERREKRKEIKVGKERDKGGKPGKGYKPGKPGKGNKPGKPGKPGRPNKEVVIINRPAPRPCPPPPPRRYCYNNGVDDAVSAFLSIVGLMAIIAD
ncbi:MAG: hypothetical protein Q4F44_05640 [Bacteroidales bacterium]|nr:hypothetical protein [Bacteroidales bacterium]